MLFYKQNRKLLLQGTFYRLLSPFEGNFAAWEVAEHDSSRALVTVTRILSEINGPYRRLPLLGLNPNRKYHISSKYLSYEAYGDELMQFGLMLEDLSSGQSMEGSCEDFRSLIYEVVGL